MDDTVGLRFGLYVGVERTADTAEGVGDGLRGVFVVLERTVERISIFSGTYTILERSFDIAALGAHNSCRCGLTNFDTVFDESEKTFLLADDRARLSLIKFHLSV